MTTLYRELTDAYHNGDGATVGRLLAKVRARARAAERARQRKPDRVLRRPENFTAQFPPPPRNVRRAPLMSPLALATSRRLRRYKRLIRDGAIINGLVTHVNDDEVGYTYRPPFAPSYEGETIGARVLRVEPGDVVMVFYDARRPWRSVAYEASGFETDRYVGASS